MRVTIVFSIVRSGNTILVNLTQKSIVIIPLTHKILKQDLPIYLESDEELIKAKQKVEYNAMCMDSCERILKQIQQRGWDIKNAIEWRKFVDGAL